MQLGGELRTGFDSLVLLVTWAVWCERNYRQLLHGANPRKKEASGTLWLQAGFPALAALLAAVQD